MQVIRVQRQIDSETLYLPELKPLVGKNVEIVIREQEPSSPREHDWQPLIDAAAEGLVDPDVYRQFREFDRQHNTAAQ
jgi:hypothetical protein